MRNSGVTVRTATNGLGLQQKGRASAAAGLAAAAMLVLGGLVAGCSTTSGGLQKISDGALEVVGLKTPELTAAELAAAKTITLRVVAGSNLNADPRGRGISLVVRLYALRDVAAFSRVPYEQLLDQVREKAALGADLVEVKEIVLAPGKQVTQIENIPAEGKYLAVVGQFLNPAPERWRFVFPVDANAKNGILIGAHECALTVSQGVLAGATVSDPGSLNAVRCKKSL
jgi:type VI secretion system protein VasD